MEEISWRTETRHVRDLIPSTWNPRRLSAKQRADLTASLSRFNLVEIPVINTDNVIVAGHQRLSILHRLGRADELIDVRVPSRALTLDEMREYNIRSNKNVGDWDAELLFGQFQTAELIDWGFTDEEIQAFQTQMKLPNASVKDAPVIDYMLLVAKIPRDKMIDVRRDLEPIFQRHGIEADFS